jgi:hypothetical protein
MRGELSVIALIINRKGEKPRVWGWGMGREERHGFG